MQKHIQHSLFCTPPPPPYSQFYGFFFFFFLPFPHPLLLSVLPLLHSTPSCFFPCLYLCFSRSQRIAGLLRRAAEPWDRPWLKLPVNDKGPNAAAHALILICMHPRQHIFPLSLSPLDIRQTETQRQPFWNSCMKLHVMEELCPGHQQGQNGCNKSTCTCLWPRNALLIPPGPCVPNVLLHVVKEREHTYRKVHDATLQLFN